MPGFKGNRGTKKLKQPCHIMKHIDDIGLLAAFGRHIDNGPR